MLTTWLRRTLGAAVVAGAAAPLFWLLAIGDPSPWSRATLAAAERTWALGLWGGAVAALVGVALALLTRARGAGNPSGADRIRTLGVAMLAWIRRPSSAVFAAGVGTLAFVAALAVRVGVFRGYHSLVDEMAMAVHARFLAGGYLAGPVGEQGAAWLMPNLLLVEQGLVSQYPPGHLAVLALAERLGIAWAVGPLLFGTMAASCAAALPRLIPERVGEARVAAGLLALSPFMLLLGAGSLSHLSAGAFGALALWAAVRARDGAAGWAVPAGAAVGLMVAARPWTGLVLGTVFTGFLWAHAARDKRRLPWLARRVTLLLAGGLPVAAAFAWYNFSLFGSPLRLGYQAAYGPAHGLGFHSDPWGYPYGLREAVGFSSGDFTAFGLQLLETPIPVTAAAGMYLLLAARPTKAWAILAAWAVLPVLANAAYWFHQPRMLFETGPAWLALGVLGVTYAGVAGPPEASAVHRTARDAVVWAVVAAVAMAALYTAPQRIAGSGFDRTALAWLRPPLPPDGPTVVFVHSSWNERLGARLLAVGVRGDSIQSLMRRNDVCAIHEYLRAVERTREPGSLARSNLDSRLEPGAPPALRPVTAGPRLIVQRADSVPFTDGCAREVNADRFGAISLPPLVWQGDLPALVGRGTLYARDLGPTENRRLRNRLPDRTAWMLLPGPEGAPQLLPYDRGVRLLWGEPEPGASP